MELNSKENKIIRRATSYSDIWTPVGRFFTIAFGLFLLGSGLYNLGNDSFISTYEISPGYVAAIGLIFFLAALVNGDEKERKLLLKLSNQNSATDS